MSKLRICCCPHPEVLVICDVILVIFFLLLHSFGHGLGLDNTQRVWSPEVSCLLVEHSSLLYLHDSLQTEGQKAEPVSHIGDVPAESHVS